MTHRIMKKLFGTIHTKRALEKSSTQYGAVKRMIDSIQIHLLLRLAQCRQVFRYKLTVLPKGSVIKQPEDLNNYANLLPKFLSLLIKLKKLN